METAFCPTETRSQIHVVAGDIGNWLTGIVSSVDIGAVKRADLDALQRELRQVERQLEHLTTEMILDR